MQKALAHFVNAILVTVSIAVFLVVFLIIGAFQLILNLFF